MLEGYQHETVNHSPPFIDPETGAYTNSIESLQQKFKEGHKTRYGTESALFEFVSEWIHMEKMYAGNALYHLWS